MPPTESFEGFWGKPTATIDWCEKNYEVTYYVAEWWNTVTNLLIILPALWGIREVLNKGYKRRFLVLYFLIALVGVGSWLFHMTLLYSYQLLDELPMVFFSLTHSYYLMEVPHPASKNFFSNKPLFFFLFLFSASFTLIYLVWPQPLFHEFVFAGLIFWTWFQQGRIVSRKRCRTCKTLLLTAIGLMLFAFFLWNVDIIFCSTLEDIRRQSSPGLRPFTQLHGWWHALGGISGNLQVLFAIHTWYDFHKEKEEKRKLEVTHAGFSLQWR